MEGDCQLPLTELLGECEGVGAAPPRSPTGPAARACVRTRPLRQDRPVALTLETIVADITTLQVDAVVNAANPALAGGGGVDGAIHRAAGVEDLRRACRLLGGCRPGDAKATPGFALSARWIIHTVGPVWHGGDDGEHDLLASCYRRCIEVADELGARSVAFPAIATGVYGFPSAAAAQVAVGTLSSLNPATVERAVLVAFDESTSRTYRRLLGHELPGS
jgi:O-acetyl-ADP-ribose deacetylase